MPHFENSELNVIEKKIKEMSTEPKVGTVKRVYEHRVSDDASNFEVNVQIDAGTVPDLQRVPVHTPGSETISVPKVGDKIIVFYEDGDQSSPIAMGIGWTNKDRPPLGRVGMYRNRFDSGDSPLGEGDLHLTGYTSYDDAPNTADADKSNVSAEEAFIQVSKHVEGDNVDPSKAGEIPFKFEVHDSPKDDAGHVSIEINGVNSSDTDTTWGMKFDFKTGEFKLVDPNGYGIKSDGFGNLTLEYDTLTKNETSDGSLGI